MPYAEFGAPKHQRREPITFRLLDEPFAALPEAPAGAVNDLMAGIQLDETGSRVYSAPNLIRFVVAVLREETIEPWTEDTDVDDDDVLTQADAVAAGFWVSPEHEHVEKFVVVPTDDVQRFMRLVNSKRTILPIDVLGECVMWLSEKLTNRPTLPSVRSARGRS